jgi:hypothetical protein
MKDAKTIEERLAAVERELADLKTRLPPEPVPMPKSENWVEKISGSMKDYPEFDEVLRLGKEFRDSDRPSDDDAA